MRILGMRGIWNPMWGGSSFVDALLEELEHSCGYQTQIVRYPFMTAALTGYFGPGRRARAQILIETYRPGDVIVAFSAGVLLTLTAMNMGGRFGKVFLFGGAAEPDVEFPESAYEHVYNVYSQSDFALKMGSLMPWHPFGTLGIVGYTGGNRRVTNIPFHGVRHSEYVQPEHVRRWAGFIDDVLRPPMRVSRRKRRKA